MRFVRLVYGAWMVPAGLEHFIHIFPQPMGGTPRSSEVINALLASHLFDIVKAVELVAGGLCVLSGFYTPLALVVCMPVAFNVFYWDAPLMGWTSSASHFGDAVLFCSLFLCAAYYRSYRAMFTLWAKPRTAGAPSAPAAAQTAGA